jgi:hypothetical protein
MMKANLILVALVAPFAHAAENGDQALPRPVTEAFAGFDKAVGEVAKRAGSKARAALDSEIKRQTRAGDLETALAAKNALQSIEARLDKMTSTTSQPASPIGKWQTQDARVLVIDASGTGTIIRGNENPEPLVWKMEGGRYALRFPTLSNMPNGVIYIWPEQDGSWAYASTDGAKAGSMKKLP